MLFDAWWVWMVAGLALAILEVLSPAYIFLGFAAGAMVTGALILTGFPLAGWMQGSLANHLLVFALASLAAWLALRATFGPLAAATKVWDKDINEN